MRIIEVVHEHRDMSKAGTPGPRRVPLRVAFRADRVQSVRETFSPFTEQDGPRTTITLEDDRYQTREIVVEMPYQQVLQILGWQPEKVS